MKEKIFTNAKGYHFPKRRNRECEVAKPQATGKNGAVESAIEAPVRVRGELLGASGRAVCGRPINHQRSG